MKNLKQIPKIAFVVIALLLGIKSTRAQTPIDMNVSSQSGTVYLCDGVTYDISYTGLPMGYWVPNNSSAYSWNGSRSIGCGPTYEMNGIEGCESAGQSFSATVTATNGVLNWYFTANFIGASTTVSGATAVCENSSVYTYTVSTNVPSPTNYDWTAPTCYGTPSCNNTGTCTTPTYTVSGSTSSSGSVQVTVTSGCAVSNASNSGSIAVNYAASKPATPSGSLTFSQTGHSCNFDATISPVSTALSYVWSLSSSMSPTICGGSYTTYPCGDFDYSTEYNIYVEVGNGCGTNTTPGHWEKTTPGKPNGCVDAPIRPNNQSVVTEDFKIYPNPTSNMLNIEYPTVSNDPTDETCVVYDMLGHKVASWTLPYSENKVVEDASTLQNGVYLYIISSGSDILTRGKFVVQK